MYILIFLIFFMEYSSPIDLTKEVQVQEVVW